MQKHEQLDFLADIALSEEDEKAFSEEGGLKIIKSYGNRYSKIISAIEANIRNSVEWSLTEEGLPRARVLLNSVPVEVEKVIKVRKKYLDKKLFEIDKVILGWYDEIEE